MNKTRTTEKPDKSSKIRTNITMADDTDAKVKALRAADRRTLSALFAVLVDGEFDRRYGKRKVAA